MTERDALVILASYSAGTMKAGLTLREAAAVVCAATTRRLDAHAAKVRRHRAGTVTAHVTAPCRHSDGTSAPSLPSPMVSPQDKQQTSSLSPSLSPQKTLSPEHGEAEPLTSEKPAVPEVGALPAKRHRTAPLPEMAPAPSPPPIDTDRRTWMSPYFDEWAGRGGSRLAGGKHAPYLARLELLHGPAETLKRWGRMLELTPLRFASGAKLEEAWGDFGASAAGARKADDGEEARAGRFYDVAVVHGWLSAPDAGAVERRVATARRRVDGLDWDDAVVIPFLVQLDRRGVNEAGNRRWAVERLVAAGRIPVITVDQELGE